MGRGAGAILVVAALTAAAGCARSDAPVDPGLEGLALASVWCWAIIIDKSMLYARANRAAKKFEKTFWSGQSLEELYRSLSGRTPQGMASVFVAAMREWKRSFEAGARSQFGLQSRIDKVLDARLTLARP